MYQMTYNHKGVTGCSARGIVKRESEEEHIPMDIFANMKELK